MSKKTKSETMLSEAPTPKIGRPEGGGVAAPTRTVSTATVQPSVCLNPSCKSERRSKYFGIITQKYLGQSIIRKRCKCLDCGQIRVDRFIENEWRGPEA